MPEWVAWPVRRVWPALGLLTLLIGSCSPTGPGPEEDSAQGAVPACPVTIPSGFSPPEPFPARPASDPDALWHGSARLWTQLSADGTYVPRKSVWWSADFRGGREEERPDIAVTWSRLDVEVTPIESDRPGTNAFTAEDGWFMIAGIDPDFAGCWRVTARYRGAELSYVYERT